MGRLNRVLGEGVSYHVTARGNNRQLLFETDQDRQRFLGLLVEVARSADWIGLAYCLMGNHFHLALTTPRANLSEGMRNLLGRYARDFNRANRRSGHLFRQRFWSAPIESDRQLLAVIRYIARNPVAAGLVGDARDWRWGSHQAIAGGLRGIGFVDDKTVLGLLHAQPWRARLALDYFVSKGPDDSNERMSSRLVYPPKPQRPSVAKVMSVLPRAAAVRVCIDLGYTHTEIASACGVARSTISHALRAVSDDSPQVSGTLR